MKKIKELRLPILISIVPAALLILHIIDFIDLSNSKGEYPFGSEFVSSASIYTSERIYVVYSILSTIILLLAIYFTFKRKRILCIVFLFLGAMLFLYPIITASS